MSALSDRILRNFIRYKNDGKLPGVLGELPIGDPASGAHTPTIEDWRRVFDDVEAQVLAAALHEAAAEAAAALAQAYAQEAVSQGNVPIYGTVSSLGGLSIPMGISAFRLNGYYNATDGGGGFYVETLDLDDTTSGVIGDASSPQRFFRLRIPVADVRAFGAKGDGTTDDRAAIQEAINYAVFEQVPLYFPRINNLGRYLIDSITQLNPAAALVIDLNSTESDMDVIMEGEIIAGPNIHDFFVNGYLIRISGDHHLRWRGGRFNMTQVPLITPQGSGTGSIFAAMLDGGLDIEGVIFDGGTTVATSQDASGSGGVDTHLATKGLKFLRVAGCRFIGAYDSGIYMSGNQSGDTIAHDHEAAFIIGNRFDWCGNAMALKRLVNNVMIEGNFIKNCGNGVLFGDTGDGVDKQGYDVTITGNRIRKIQGSPIVCENTEGVQIIGNHIEDFGRWLADGTTETARAVGNYAAGIKLNGASFCTVIGNTIRFRDWLPVQTAQKQGFGVVLRNYTKQVGDIIFSRTNVVMGNVFHGTYGPVLATANAENNILGPNRQSSTVLNPTIDNGDNNRRWDRIIFVPNLAGAVSNLNGSNYDLRQGMLSFKDDEVTVNIWIDINAVSGLNGNVKITGTEIPIAASGVTRYVGLVALNGVTLNTNYTHFSAEIDAGSNEIQLFEVGSGIKQALGHAAFGADTRVGITITYRVAV